MSYEEHQAMWPQMIAALAAIDAALDLPEDGCNSLAQTLAEIARLKKAEEKTNSYIVDNARLAEDAARYRWLRDNTHPDNLRKLFSGCPVAPDLGPNVGGNRQ